MFPQTNLNDALPCLNVKFLEPVGKSIKQNDKFSFFQVVSLYMFKMSATPVLLFD